MDITRIDTDGRTHPEGAATKDQYYAWNEAVLATGRGRVVSVADGQRDIEIGETPSPDVHPAGNHVVVQHGWGLYSVYAHLQQGSIAVSVGDRVERGQLLGRVGNSGSTTEPRTT